MTITDEMLSAFIDGELPPEDAARVRAALLTDKELGDRLAVLKSPDALIAAAYGAIDEEPMPESVLALLAVERLDVRRERKVISFPGADISHATERWVAPLAASIALAVGVGVGMQLAPAPSDSGIALAGVIDKGSPIYRALVDTRSGETAPIGGEGATLTPALSFRSKDGRLCREFFISAQDAGRRGLACQSERRWRIEVMIAAAPQEASGYATASSGVALDFDALVDTAMGGDAMSEEEEKAFIASGWRDGD